MVIMYFRLAASSFLVLLLAAINANVPSLRALDLVVRGIIILSYCESSLKNWVWQNKPCWLPSEFPPLESQMNRQSRKSPGQKKPLRYQTSLNSFIALAAIGFG
jgi:hypothetical protein